MLKVFSFFLFTSILTCTLSGCLYKQPDAVSTDDDIHQAPLPKEDKAISRLLSPKKTPSSEKDNKSSPNKFFDPLRKKDESVEIFNVRID